MFFLRMAALSILTHRRRSVIIAVSVLVCVVFMILVAGMLGGLRRSFFDDLLQQSGHLQIHAAGWEKRLDPYSLVFLLRDPKPMIRRIEGDPFIASRLLDIEPMLQFGALLIHGDRNLAIAGQAVEPSTRFFARVRSTIRAGAFLPSGDLHGSGVAVSTSIAHLLDLALGDSVVVLVQDATGSPYYLSYPVTGTFDSGVQQTDEGLFFISLDDAQRLLDLPNRASELRVTLKTPDAADGVGGRIAALFPEQKPLIQTWRDIQGGLISLINLGDIYSTVMDVIIAVVAATVITSSILMTIFERIPTFGTLRAIGLKRRQLFWILMEEGALLGCAGAILGMAVGVPLEVYLQVHGLNVGAFSRVLGTATTYHFALTLRGAITIFAAGVLIAAGGYLYGAVVSIRTSLLSSLEQGSGMGLAAIGLRNIARNPRRSALNITALGIGVAVMIIGLGWIRGYYTTIYGGVKRLETGDLQILRDGYLDQERRLPLDIVIPDAYAVARRISADPLVEAVAPRVDFSATVGTEAGSVRVLGRAIEPAAEARVTTIRQFIQQGSYFSPDKGGILLGAPLARKLGLVTGQSVALSAVDKYSVQNFVEVPVAGIFLFGLPSLDEGLVIVDMATARGLLSTPGAATRLVVRLKDGVSERKAAASIRELLRGMGDSVYSWRAFAGVIVSATSADIGGFWIIFFVIFLLVIIGIVNSMSMAVQERTREIGTLRAIGIRRSQLAVLFLVEAASLALVAAAIGCLLGGLFAWYMTSVGFDFSSTSLEMPIPFGHRFTGDYRPVDFLFGSAVSLASALTGSLLPTRRAARLSIPRSLGTRVE